MVDANGWLGRAVEAGLADEGVEVVRASTAFGALSVCAARDALCVVTDLELADHDGLWLTATLRDGGGHIATVPVVILADHPSAAICAAAIQAGVDLVLDRGGAVADLQATVRALVAMHRRLRGEAARRLAKAGADARSRTPTGRSGTQRRVTPPPSHAVEEVVVPSARPDPRAEPLEDIPTRVQVWRK